MSRGGRRRLALGTLRTIIVLVVIGGVAWAGWELVRLGSGGGAWFANAVDAKPIARVTLQSTDGVLDEAWLQRTLALAPGTTLLDIDIEVLKARLEARPQVEKASVTKRFPDVLEATLSERSPVARLMTSAGSELLVARDGVVYEGIGYDPELLEMLPWLNLDSLAWDGGTYGPVPGMEAVSDLLGLARLVAPQVYDSWKVVDLTRLESDREIEVRSVEVARIVFGADADFFTQLAWFDYLLDQPGPALAKVDLSLGPRVVVSYDENAPRLARPVPDDTGMLDRRAPFPNFPPLPPSFQTPRAL